MIGGQISGATDSVSLDLTPFVRRGDTIVIAQAHAEPLTLTRALVEQRHQFERSRLVIGIGSAGTLQPEHADAFDFVSYCASGSNRALADAGVLDIFPGPYSQFATAMCDGGASKADVVLLQLSPPDAQGRHSLGLANDYLIAAIRAARVVIAEINPAVPWTHGALTLGIDDLALAVPARFNPLQAPPPAPSAIDLAIARRVAGLIEDGATLQLGLGGAAHAVLPLLMGHRHLGLHSGIAGDGIVALAEAGVLTNDRKAIDRGVGITGLLIGSARLQRFAHRNPALQLRPSDYTHAAATLAAIERFVAINSAVEVDLSGQVNAEVAGGRYVGAVGGAPDFLRAAQHSRGGLPIVALPATAGPRSRIVANLSGPVTTPRCDAGLIVTEHGVADLRGLTLRQRRQRMLELAAPEHREALAVAAASGAAD